MGKKNVILSKELLNNAVLVSQLFIEKAYLLF
jgi:hypothetical protein